MNGAGELAFELSRLFQSVKIDESHGGNHEIRVRL